MTKKGGLGQGLWIAGVDCSGDTGSWSIASPKGVQDVTGIDKYANERLALTRDASVSCQQFFNPDAGSAFQTTRANAFSQVLNFDLTIATGSTLGDPAFSGRYRLPNTTYTRNADGSFTFAAEFAGNSYGAEWGHLLTAGKRTDTSATAPATGVDFNADGGASTTLGWQAWLHVFAFTGTSVTVTIQDSANNSAFTDLTGGAFTAATAVGTQRLEGGRTATVRRYLKVNTTGTFSNAVFAVAFTRNVTATSFIAA
jgi:hypothetical protein